MAYAAAIPPASQYTLLRLGMCFTSSARLWPSDEKKLPLGFAASSPTAAAAFCCCPVATTGGEARAVESCATVPVSGARTIESAAVQKRRLGWLLRCAGGRWHNRRGAPAASNDECR